MEHSAFPQSAAIKASQRTNVQAEKGAAFRALHQRDRAFIIPNPWDVGSARLLAHLGFEALASTSAGYAFSAGKPDGAIGREQMMMHIADLATATPLPVSADLQNGFGDTPEAAAESIAAAAAAYPAWRNTPAEKIPSALPAIRCTNWSLRPSASARR